MSPRSLPYPVFDIDNHMYETTDALTKYLPKEHRERSATSRSTADPNSSSRTTSAT